MGGGPVAAGVTVNESTALQCSVILAISTVLSEDVAKLPVRLLRVSSDGRMYPERRHPVARLFKEPNRWQTWFDFKAFLVHWLVMRGNGYAWIRRDADGRPVELVPIRADRVEVQVDPMSADIYYTIGAGDEFEAAALRDAGTMIAARDMLHIKGKCRNAYEGLSYVQLLREGVGIALATERHAGKLFGTGTQIPGYLKHQGRISSEAAESLKAQWQSAYSGVNNAFKTPVLEEGMEYVKIGMTAEDSQFLQSRQFQVVDLARPYRIPLHMLGDLSRATFSNIESQSIEYLTNTLMPYVERMEAEFARKLLTPRERSIYDVEFDTERLLRGDFKTRMEGLKILSEGGALSVNEWREATGRNAVEGGDVYRRPLNTAFVDAEGRPVMVTPPSASAGGEGDAEENDPADDEGSGDGDDETAGEGTEGAAE